MSYFTSKRLRLVQKGYEQYSGPIGAYEFVNGISVELIPLNARDRLSAAFQMVEVDEDGGELEASVSARLIRDRANVIESTAPLKRMTEEEKADENVAVLLGSEKRKELLTQEALEAIAAKDGIAGVRAVAEQWDVRSKSIPELIAMIVKAQADYRTDRIEALVNKGAVRTEVEALFALKGVEVAPQPEPKVEAKPEPKAEAKPKAPAKAKADATAKAAQTGDLAAALSAE